MLYRLWEDTDLVDLRSADLERSPNSIPEDQAQLGCRSREVHAATDLLRF